MRKFLILLQQDQDGWITAECPELPGCVSQGRTEAEVLKNIHEAIQASLETRATHGLPLEVKATIREVEVEVPA